MRAVLLAACLLGLVAATPALSASRHAITDADLAGFKIGQATYADVVAKLGAPQSQSTDSTGQRTIVYMRSSATPKLASFVPVVGLFAGGAKSSMNIAVVVFDASGRLERFQVTNADSSCDLHVFGVSCGAAPAAAPPAPETH
jgi:hypothetical protein